VSIKASLFNSIFASLPKRPSADTTKREKCCRFSKQGSKYYFVFSCKWAANTLSGFLDFLDFASRSIILTSRMQYVPLLQRLRIKTSPLSPLGSLPKRPLTGWSCRPLGDSLPLVRHEWIFLSVTNCGRGNALEARSTNSSRISLWQIKTKTPFLPSNMWRMLYPSLYPSHWDGISSRDLG
jgi:hypothetical protein